MRPRSLAGIAMLTLGLLAGCGSDGEDGSTGETSAGTTSASLTDVAGGTADCLGENGFGEALTADIFVVETETAVDPGDGYSVLAVTEDGRDVQVMIFSDAGSAKSYATDAASDGDDITRDTVADGRVVVESGFRAENGSDLEDPADDETLATVESCVTGAGL